MTMKEYEREITMRMVRRVFRRYGWIIMNPLVYLTSAIAVLAAFGLEVS